MSLLLELTRAVREIYECSTKNTATSDWLIHDTVKFPTKIHLDNSL